ncbi:MAG: corrinoid protein [Dehalococcoidia bacterium]|nr:corrinoid protein [Dehalococcoidia bacterium]
MAAETLENLKRAILDYDDEGAATWARKAVEQRIDPIEAIDVLTEAIRVVGDGFGKGELWLPDLVGAATAMKSAMPIIEDEIQRTGKKRETLGTVVLGTVYGDIHDIGKNMVGTLLTANGFTVYDVGINITAEEFVEAVKKHKPDILAMSALMTMTSYQQMNVIAGLKDEGLRDQVKIMVGGGAITQEFADSIGADGYEPSAPGAVSLARKLMGIE